MGSNLTGLALRAAVAEWVMGFKRYTGYGYTGGPGRYHLMHPGQEDEWPGLALAPDGCSTPYNDYADGVPPYEEDIAAAWQVAERMNQYSEFKNEAEEGIYAAWLIGMDRFKLWKFPAKRAARKICETALEALGYKEG
jgi:hypothetical protein